MCEAKACIEFLCLLHCNCVQQTENYHVCVCVVVGMMCKEYDYILFWVFYVYIFVDLVKHGVLTLVGDVDLCLSVVELTIAVLSW